MHWDPRYLYEKLIADPEELDWFLQEVVDFEWHHEHDRGVPFAASLSARALEYPDCADLIYAFRERWDETIPGEIEGTVKLLRELHAQGVPCFALTNYSAETWPDLETRFDWVGLFRDAVVSGREGVVKPQAPIYHIARERFRLEAGEGFFVDDKEINVRAAEAAGFIGHHFESPEKLEKDLKARGLL